MARYESVDGSTRKFSEVDVTGATHTEVLAEAQPTEDPTPLVEAVRAWLEAHREGGPY